MFVLSVDGDLVSTGEPGHDESWICLGNADDTEWRCGACNQPLSEEVDGFADEDGSLVCDAYEPDDEDIETAPEAGEGPHRAQRVPLGWPNSAAIHTEPDQDSITLLISVGDPRGAFALTVRRIPDNAPEHAGQLVMHTPYPGEPMPHRELSEHHTGTYLVG